MSRPTGGWQYPREDYPTTVALAIKDEGSTVQATPNKINFTGAGVTATDDGSGGANVDIPGGGGGGGGTANSNWDRTALPTHAAILTARTVDFSTLASLTGWTWTNQGTATAALQRKRLYMTAPSNGSAVHSKRLFTPPSANQLPATPWCVQVPVTLYATERYPEAGIYIKNTANGKGLACGIQVRDDVGKGYVFNVVTMTNETTGVTDLAKGAVDSSGVIAVAFDGTDFSFYYSPDGRDWPPIATVTQSAAAFIGAGGTYEWSLFVDSLEARPSGGAFNNAVILNQTTPVPHGQLVTAGSGSGGGALVFLAERDVTGAASADFTGVMTSDYDEYQLVWDGVKPGTNAAVVGIQLSADNGASWITSGYEYGNKLLGNSTAFETYQRAGAQAVALIGTNALSSTVVSAGVTQILRADVSERKAIISQGVCGNSDGNTYGTFCTASYPTTVTVSAIRILATSGTITGRFRLYGIAKVAGGGSSISGDDEAKRFPWDVLPTSPTTLDDPFTGSTLDAKWATIGSGGLTKTVKRGWLYLEATPTGAAFDVRGIEQVLPSGNFSVSAPVFLIANGTYGIAGLHLRNTTTNQMLRYTLHHNGANASDSYMGLFRYNSLTNRSAIIGQNTFGLFECVLRMTYDGTTLKFDWSRDGITFNTYATEAIGTTFGGGAPNRVGLSLDPYSATLPGRMAYQSFRYSTDPTKGIGAFAA